MENKYLPIFLQINDRQCLVVGGGTTALRRIEQLIEAGARVHAISTRFSDKLIAMANSTDMLRLETREYTSIDLSSYTLAVAATDQAEVNQLLYDDAIRAGIPVNVVDEPALCTFISPAVVRRGQMTIAIGTSGACPSLSSRVRRELQESYPEWYASYIHALGNVREWLKQRCPDSERRKEILAVLSGSELAESLQSMDESEMEKSLRQSAERLMPKTDEC